MRNSSSLIYLKQIVEEVMGIQMPNLNARYRGALVGVLAGDALGAPYETWLGEKVQADIQQRDGLELFDYPDPWNKDGIFPKGRPTDDSDHTAVLAQSLCIMKCVDEEDIYLRLRSVVYKHMTPLWGGRAVGAGRTTKKMLEPLTWEESRGLSAEDAFPSNGSLMRTAPLALYFGKTENIDLSVIRKVSMITHRHELAVECCIAYVIILTAVLEGKSIVEGIKNAISIVKDKALVDMLKWVNREPTNPQKWPGRGAALLSLHIALRASLNAKYFEDGMYDCVAIGGDTDTYAAIAGGLLGARFGIGGIPNKWRKHLKGCSIMEHLATRLLAMQHH